MRTLFLIRHAQASLGTDDYDRLSDTGLLQAEVVGRHMLDCFSRQPGDWALLRGDLKRHRQTSEPIESSLSVGIQPTEFEARGVEVDANLNEYRVDGLLAAAFADADRLNIHSPGAAALADPKAYLGTFLELFPSVLAAWQENRLECSLNGRWRAFQARVESAGHRIRQRMHDHRAVVAVTSAGVISTLTTCLIGCDLAWQRALNVALYNASVTELRLDDTGGWQLQRLNCVAHFPQPDQRTLA